MKRFRFGILLIAILAVHACGGELKHSDKESLKMTEVTCIEQTSNYIVFAWTQVEGASHYEITIDFSKTVSCLETQYKLSKLAAESEHTVAVKAISASAAYLDSDEVSCTASTIAESGYGDDNNDEDHHGDNNGDNCSAYSWFELPKIEDSNNDRIWDSDNSLYLAYHYCGGGEKGSDGKTARNYSVCFSGTYHCPVWVAAPRHSMYEGSANRTDAYTCDPDIPSELQYYSKSTASGCNKGHMLGSAERTSSAATNRQVFYYSNIAPQLSSGFNTGNGGWNLLEDYIDGLVVRDTLYEVIGCYFDKYTDGYGNTVEPNTISFGGRDDVGMPTMFYYAVLRTKKGTTGKSVRDCSADELICVAFVRSHTNNLKGQKPSSKEMMSIADLEKLTGFTYFDSVPNAPKDSFTPSDWGL